MPWLKFRHKFGSGKGSWEWKDLGERLLSNDALDGTLHELREIYDDGGHQYRGIDHEIVLDIDVPAWVIEERTNETTQRFKTLEEYVLRLDALSRYARPCPTCDGLEQMQHGSVPGVRIDDCLSCGRERVIATEYPKPLRKHATDCDPKS